MAQSAKQSVNSKDTLFAGAMPKGIGAPEFLKVRISGFSSGSICLPIPMHAMLTAALACRLILNTMVEVLSSPFLTLAWTRALPACKSHLTASQRSWTSWMALGRGI